MVKQGGLRIHFSVEKMIKAKTVSTLVNFIRTLENNQRFKATKEMLN